METDPGQLPRSDLLLAAVLAAAMALAALTTSAVGPLPRVGAAVAAAGLLGLALRRRRPFAATAVVVAVIVTEVVPAPEGSQAPAFLALMVAAYSLGAYARPAGLAAGLATATGGIPGLVERARACGLDVHLDAVPARVDPARDAVAYRIVQEALTNASRHAPGARVRLRLRVTAGTIDLQVDNDRPPYRPVESAGSGHGLHGMAERAVDCGGTLEAGPTPEGGFRVHATLPAVASLDGALA
jgi:hypothetical protein